jgi:hypothetical protein
MPQWGEGHQFTHKSSLKYDNDKYCHKFFKCQNDKEVYSCGIVIYARPFCFVFWTRGPAKLVVNSVDAWIQRMLPVKKSLPQEYLSGFYKSYANTFLQWNDTLTTSRCKLINEYGSCSFRQLEWNTPEHTRAISLKKEKQ